MSVLITGGAGYIGSNLCVELINNGYDIIVVDDFVNAKEKYIEKLKTSFIDKIKMYKVGVCNEQLLETIFNENDIEGVIHLAARKYVDESIKNPQEYLDNNINSTKSVLSCINKYNVKKLLFASSVVVYGNPLYLPVDECHLLNPLNPYAVSKMECETLINEWAKEEGNTAIICRFSNPVGANTTYMLGDDPKSNKKNLFPYICEKVNNEEKLMFNGNDHPTRDGTSIRDYIHVSDLVYIVAQLYKNIEKSVTCNVARGEGYTVLETLKTFESVLGKKMEYGFKPKRENDVSDISFTTKKLKKLIDFEYKKDLTGIVKSQLEFSNNK